MRGWREIVALALLASAGWAWAQSYSVNWSTVDGGGGSSTGGVYSVCGTLGQPDAGVMGGGDFTLVGGFWSVIGAVQTPGAPMLTVTLTTTDAVVVWWPAPGNGWLLQATGNLATDGGGWWEIPPPYQTNGDATISFTEPAPVGNRFYRLHKP